MLHSYPRLLTALFIALIHATAHGSDYYICSTGDDTHPGRSVEQAWRTLDRASQQDFEPGDRLLLEGGQSFPGNLVLDSADAGTAEKPVTIGSYGTGRAVILAGTGTAVLVLNAGGVEVENLVCRGEGEGGSRGCGIAFVNTLPGNTQLRHVRMRNVEAVGFGRDPKPFRDRIVGFQPVEGCGVFVGGVPDDQGKSGYSDIHISGCVAHGNEYYGILITGYWAEKATTYANKNVRIDRCTVYDNSGDPEFMENHSGSGILVEDTDGGVVEYCTAYNNGFLCRSTAGGPCGIWAAGSNKIVIQRCEAYENKTAGLDGNGFDLDGGMTNSILQYNYSHGNDGAGYLIYNYPSSPFRHHNNTVRFNLSENDGRRNRYYGSIHIGTGGPPITGLRVYHNTLYIEGSENKALVLQGDVETLACNNIFMTTGGGLLVKNETANEKNRLMGNAYWSGEDTFRVLWKGASYGSLEQWRIATGQETVEKKPVGLQADPALRNAGKGGTVGDPTKLSSLYAYQPKEGSPVTNQGLDLLTLFNVDPGEQDFYGNPLGKAVQPDIGVHSR